ncbi:MAG: hypothetical protein ACRCU2_14710 [Planktothrix sp.]
MKGFVGVRNNLTESDLKALLEHPPNQPTYYCLRWLHKLGELSTKLPSDFPSPEGQMFDENREIRWQKKGDCFSVLLLSTTGEEREFRPVGNRWQVQDRDAHLYPPTETRFPKLAGETPVNIGQRYFFDADTSTVHFVALRVKKS